ncbi:MAG: nitroreductase family deazaflavin-dependent oxidoreductase [Chloroflexi bacterium]|nr:nitroreductase family deazaflavin-dependent oxidoreductase [Chloroflexota bacterium]
MQAISQRIYQAIEYFLAMHFPKRVTGIWRVIFRMPVLYYRFGFGWLMGGMVLLLTTTGRKSGKVRHTALGYGRDEKTGELVVSAGWGGKTDWFRNLQTDPHCVLHIGRRKFNALARVLPEDEAIAHMRAFLPKNPYAPRMWSHLIGEELGSDDESLRKVVRAFPSVGFKETSIT